MNPEKEKENLRKRIWQLNDSIRHAKTGDEIEALIKIRDGLERRLRLLQMMDLHPDGAFCDSEIMI